MVGVRVPLVPDHNFHHFLVPFFWDIISFLLGFLAWGWVDRWDMYAMHILLESEWRCSLL
ncbi:hypothetical protein BO78DRAFT_205369 [Aspergillus sclerotiicarbonarius CBS 121057]|uniref:Uncharacterized protein n=1 Tax=Aspergillus sclerotiicarbonarius (strain CBS 121057 / IBT 28362) TaxID=1448318 RepID=A0A319ETJ7_ASPSB|nr:hypothetical protein BO78DRAFT_205369 [Aspergillus sclerotiicarbonarius CBS 121057]